MSRDVQSSAWKPLVSHLFWYSCSNIPYLLTFSAKWIPFDCIYKVSPFEKPLPQQHTYRLRTPDLAKNLGGTFLHTGLWGIKMWKRLISNLAILFIPSQPCLFLHWLDHRRTWTAQSKKTKRYHQEVLGELHWDQWLGRNSRELMLSHAWLSPGTCFLTWFVPALLSGDGLSRALLNYHANQAACLPLKSTLFLPGKERFKSSINRGKTETETELCFEMPHGYDWDRIEPVGLESFFFSFNEGNFQEVSIYQAIAHIPVWLRRSKTPDKNIGCCFVYVKGKHRWRELDRCGTVQC